MEMYPETYWHLADSNSLIFHNAYLGKGELSTISRIATDDLSDATTPYAFYNQEQEKEDVFEKIRLVHYKRRPSRMKSFFCFSSFEDAERAQAEWFGGKVKEMVEVRIPKTSSVSVHTADSKLLDGGCDQWQDNAHRYWQGQTTDDPFMETIVHGTVFFPGWKKRPFGILTPL